ncbi:hypothetical protein RJZ56_003628 [Blastomyces dermatitidis]|uniref:Uncharacterized protein n=2 Tax=Blastomyces TaxID=229219 RepID=A0A179UCJ4_BLAGS|nr:uncharacterized protein BDBG_01469 [Blastomyces gilchristii SLH14081]EGE85913.2 hypothetical protein BDDG_08858 [Blastomyces dermatitidis ATCC 18188]OAT05009.1 hypothetical protein BDBG_01469 [Blastomyces gilchristii SLH14081]
MRSVQPQPAGERGGRGGFATVKGSRCLRDPGGQTNRQFQASQDTRRAPPSHPPRQRANENIVDDDGFKDATPRRRQFRPGEATRLHPSFPLNL